MHERLKFLGSIISENKHVIASKVHKSRLKGRSLEPFGKLAFKEDEIMAARVNFIVLIGDAIKEGLDQETAFEKLLIWGKETGEAIYNMGIPINEVLKDLGHFRKFIWQSLKEEIRQLDLSAEMLFEFVATLDPLLDQAAYSFSLTYINFHEMAIDTANKEFLELSIPVVPLAEGIAIVPVIGEVGSDRINILMNEIMEAASRHCLTKMIIDLSGVPHVDSDGAALLVKVIDYLIISGIEPIMAGVSPEAAMTLADAKEDFSDLKTVINLQAAF